MNIFKIIDQLKALSTLEHKWKNEEIYNLDIGKHNIQEIFNNILQHYEEYSSLIRKIKVVGDSYITLIITTTTDEISIVISNYRIDITTKYNMSNYAGSNIAYFAYNIYEFWFKSNDPNADVSIKNIINNLNDQDKLFLTLFGVEAAI